MTEALVAAGHQVRVLVRYNSQGRLGWLDSLPCRDDLDVRLGDVRDLDSCLAAVDGVETVFHLAALIGIPYSYTAPLSYLKTNVEGTYNVLQAVRAKQVSRLLITSTSEVYGTADYVPMDEGHPLKAQSPYAASKIGADQLALSFWRSFAVPVRIVRPFNVYGPRQSARAIVPTVIAQILSGQRELRLGNLSPTRDLTFVADTVAGFLAIAACEELQGQVTHVGTQSEVSVADLVRTIGEVMGVEVVAIEDPGRQRPVGSEVERLVCDSRKLQAAAGWRPRCCLREGLTATVAWFRAHHHLYDPLRYAV